MSFFTKIPDYWQRLDWQILRDGGIHLYWRREYLLADTEWFSKHDYEISEFDCDTWTSQDVMFSEFARLLRLPDYFGRNLDALDECIQDLPLTESRGALLVLRGFDTYEPQLVLYQQRNSGTLSLFWTSSRGLGALAGIKQVPHRPAQRLSMSFHR